MLFANFNFFFPFCSFRDTEVQRLSIFPIWLPHHVTYDVKIIIKTLYMRSRTNGENVLSIQLVVAKKNTNVLCGQTNGPKCNTLSSCESKYSVQAIFSWQEQQGRTISGTTRKRGEGGREETLKLGSKMGAFGKVIRGGKKGHGIELGVTSTARLKPCREERDRTASGRWFHRWEK